MPRWFDAALAIGVGALVAAVSTFPVSPVVAFLGGTVIALVGARLLRAFATEPARPEAAFAPPGLAPAAGRALMAKLPTPILVIARNGRVVYANPAAQAALPRLEPGQHFANLIRAPAFVEAVGATLADGKERQFQFTAHQGREQVFEARIALLPPDAAFGPEAQAIVQIEDRTQNRRSEQLRSDFIANASHELRTPLASIIGYIETLQHHARNDPEARERFLGIMAREAGRMKRLVDDLMSLSRIEMTEHLRPVEVWSLHGIAADSASAFLPLAQQQGVELVIDLRGGGATVLGDRDQLAQVFTNLIDNAVKYSGPGATVRVLAAAESAAHPNRNGVSVEDDGPGIPREHLHRLTERFYRVNAGQSRSKGGTGLGLAIVKHILNRHGGRLDIASTPGRGARFTVWLPRAGAEQPAGEQEPRIATGT